ncbi:MAG: B12-binding domain-containing radical SAM protein [Acidobacteria bacterium]|nr:B12-binding domain-containing radical SAM protein [Acidobacteriota bacterium]
MTVGKRLILTAPLTEMIDHAGYFIQMAMASIPMWMEFVINKKYPNWRRVKRFPDGSARLAPAGIRVLERVLSREFGAENVVVCYPEDLDRFLGPETRVVAVSTHNPLGVTFAAGVYTSIFGSSRQPINAFYTEKLFQHLQGSPYRSSFRVIVGGSGGWQLTQTKSMDRLGVDCVVEGRSESAESLELFHKALRGETLPRQAVVNHPVHPEEIVFPQKPTTFGVVEMTTGCGRRCQFCVPDLNPQISLPKEKILDAVRFNVSSGNDQISLATEDMFIWGQVHTGTPFFFPNREALLELYSKVVNTPGVRHHVLSHCTMAPAVVDPELIRRLSEILLPKSPIHFPALSSHPQKKALVPLIGLETGSVAMAKRVMPSKGVPFKIEDWPSVVLRGLEILNRNNWFPMLTLMVGNPGETDEDVRATLDLVFEMERRRLFAFLVPSVFTPLEGTRMEHDHGVEHTRDLSSLQWQLIMKCWKMNMNRGLYSWWGPISFKIGAFILWLWKLRKTNGPRFTWPLLMFSSVFPELLMYKAGRLYGGRPLTVKTRAELLQSIKPAHWKHLRADNGDLPFEPSADDSVHSSIIEVDFAPRAATEIPGKAERYGQIF